MHSNAVLYDYAVSFIGTPYKWGGDDPMGGMDCSGFVIELLQAVGVLPHKSDYTAESLHELFKEHTLTDAEFGAVVFFGTGKISHVGFCLNSLLMLEAGGGGSKTQTKEDAEQQNAFIKLRPIKYRKDLVAICKPVYPWKM